MAPPFQVLVAWGLLVIGETQVGYKFRTGKMLFHFKKLREPPGPLGNEVSGLAIQVDPGVSDVRLWNRLKWSFLIRVLGTFTLIDDISVVGFTKGPHLLVTS